VRALPLVLKGLEAVQHGEQAIVHRPPFSHASCPIA
jgi:hypothetical protein